MIRGYARVSTNSQELKIQEEELKKNGAEKIYSEKISAKRRKDKKLRPEMERLLNEIKEGDTFLCTKLDRFARSTIEALQIVEELQNRNITVRILNLNGGSPIDSSPLGKMMVSIMATFAEFERSQIEERMREGKRYAREHNKDYREGRPIKHTEEKLDFILKIKESENLTIKETANRMSVSTATLSRHIKKRKTEEAMKEYEELLNKLIEKQKEKKDEDVQELINVLMSDKMKEKMKNESEQEYKKLSLKLKDILEKELNDRENEENSHEH